MASNKTVNIESFFQALSSDAYAPLNQLLDAHGPKEMSSIANSCNSEGETPLIVAIKGNLYGIVECLVETLKASTCQLGRFIWKGLDYPQVPPLFAAILCDDSDMNITDCLVDKSLEANSTPGCVGAIMSSSLTQAMKANVLKLLGAAFILQEDKHGVSLDFGLQFWYASIRLDTVPHVLFQHQVSEWAGKVFGNISEFKTLIELEEIRRGEEHLETQALLIIQRVTREIHPDPLPYFSFALLRYSSNLQGTGLYARAIDVTMLSVQQLRARDWTDYDAINSEWPFEVVNRCLLILYGCLYEQNSRNLPLDSPNRLLFPTIIEAFRCMSSFHSKLLIQRSDMYFEISEIVENMIHCIELLPSLNPEESKEFEQWLSGYVGEIECHPGVYTLLHAACDNYNIV